MRRILKLITGRFFWTFVFLFLQMFIVAITLKYVESRFELALFSTALGVLVSLLIFSRDDVPEYRMSWILLILVVPVFGCSMYLIFGNKKKGIAQEKRMRKYHELRTSHVIDVFPKGLDSEKVLSEDHAKLSRYVSGLTDSKVFANTSTQYYPLGDLCFPHMVEELEKAKKFIMMEYFIYAKGVFWDTILDILKRKVSQGVEIFLMYDDMGSITSIPKKY